MSTLLRPAVVLFGLFSLLTGVAYPLVVTGTAQVVFPSQAGGSLIKVDDQVVGSNLVGQPFDDPRYFWGRPSATGPTPYNGAASTGSNLGPTNPALIELVQERVKTLRNADPTQASLPVPVDLVTASASGLDPHVSPAAALYQVGRVARLRALPAARVRALVQSQVERRTFGALGEPQVNVLRLNLALDALPVAGS